MNRQELLDSLQSKVCPGCNGKKFAMKTFCAKCYFKLPKYLQGQLYRKLLEGYQEAFERAITFLEAGQSLQDKPAGDDLFNGV